jgi:hypothetical protein
MTEEENKTHITSTDKPVNPELAEAQHLKQSWLVRGTHFLVNFIGIGWVLNAYVSVEVFGAIKKHKPQWLTQATEVTEKAFTAIVKAFGKTPNAHLTANISKDLVEISALGTGGFIVLPLQKIYAANRIRISEAIENIFHPKKTKDEKDQAKNQEAAIHQTESVETFSHWAAGRAIAFATSVSIYMVLKYAAKDSYAKLNTSVMKFMEKNFPKRLIPSSEKAQYYVAEQVTTVASIATLFSAKTWLDKTFPAKTRHVEKFAHPAVVNERSFANEQPKTSLKQKDLLADGAKGFRERAEMKGTEASISPL